MKRYFSSPLEQFEIFIVFDIKPICSWLENHISYLAPYALIQILGTIFLINSLILSSLMISSVNLIYIRNFLNNNGSSLFYEKYFLLIRQLLQDLIFDSRGKNIYYCLFIFLFVFINILNILGLIPFTFAFTTQFFLTFSLSFIFFCMINLTGFYYHGTNLFTLFYPEGTPIFIIPLLIIIEFISYYARMFSLAIRLFANMTAGHILLKILSWFLYLLTDIFFLSTIFGFFLITILWGLEFFIAILQAYVFLILCGIYLNDVLNLH
jgi:ATP synthase subunit 6